MALKKDVFVYLKNRVTEKRRHTSYQLIHSPNNHNDCNWANPSQEPQTLSGPPKWVAEAQVFAPTSPVFTGALADNLMARAVSVTQTSVHI